MTYHYHTDGGTGCTLTGANGATSRPNICFYKFMAVNGSDPGVIPQIFSLSQNYPNPFNPSTSIKYDIPKHSGVKLVVFDLLGREVATLVNEMKKPGSYEVTFDGTNLSSGVYFYKIEAGDFVNVKKMVLIK
jgi:hypothetical protein